jgi:hypothetical protein
MTEMIVNFKMQPRLFKPMPHPNRIDPRAFFGALIAAPFLVALLSFWAFLIPVFAIAFGGPIYLILGTPALLWALSYKDWSPANYAAFGAGVFSVAAGIFLRGAAYLERDPEVLGLAWLILLGAFFAAVWSNAFAHIYNKFKRF